MTATRINTIFTLAGKPELGSTMSFVFTAHVEGRPLNCPLCQCSRFRRKEFKVAGKWAQVLDMEFLAPNGVMLICERCTHILHFENAEAIETTDD
jgi:hypothetical protein